MMPIIGQNNEAEKLAELQRQSEIAYQKEMYGKLEAWGIEQGCLVSPAILRQQTMDADVTQATIAFKKLSNEELAKYKLLKNQQDNERNKSHKNNKA